MGTYNGVTGDLYGRKTADGSWSVWLREWDGVGQPDYTWAANVTFEEVVDLYQRGVIRDKYDDIRKALDNPLDELAKLAPTD